MTINNFWRKQVRKYRLARQCSVNRDIAKHLLAVEYRGSDMSVDQLHQLLNRKTMKATVLDANSY